MLPTDPHWYSDIEPTLQVNDETDISWHNSADMVVVGLGGAGIAAALQALEDGVAVIAVDQFEGGGATKASGGVIYAGGGTALQKAADIDDTPQNMFNYLKMETGEIVSDETLQDFCDKSACNIDWLISHNVDLRSTYWPQKTSYPAPQYFLYHSDNSLVSAYKQKAMPAARGHRGYVPVEQGRKATNLGGSLFDPLVTAAREKGLEIQTYSEARQLVLNSEGAVIGIKILKFNDAQTQANFIKMRNRAKKIMEIFPPIIPGSSFFLKKAVTMLKKAKELEQGRKAIFVRARKGVVLCAGGFVFNAQMMEHYAPKYTRSYPLGTDGDSGAGIRLGQTANGAIGNMSRISAWRFINPPVSFAHGVIVNMKGERFIDETVYGATLGGEMVENHEGEAWLILDKPLVRQALAEVKGDKALNFQRALAKLNLYFGAKKAKSVEALADLINIDSSKLKETIAHYNRISQNEGTDEFGKTAKDMRAVTIAPFYAINIGLSAKLFPCPAITLGGLVVNEKTGQVLTEDGNGIAGLYAAGRNAIGVASWNYVSGLSIADGIYSGRRAARAIQQSHE